MHSIEKNNTEVNISLNKHTITAESITVKRELDDFDSRKTENEVNQDLDQKPAIKSEEKNLFCSVNSQYLISHEEVNIKCEDDVEQSDTKIENHTVKDKIKIYKCPACPYGSRYKSNFERHSVRHRKPDEIVWHRCTECPFKTVWRNNLKLHAICHNEPGKFKIFKCAHCDFESPRKRSLQRHLWVHNGKNMPQLPCPEPECPYKTHNKDTLKRHSMVHSNVIFFKCTQCPYQAKRREHLKRHQLKHESTDNWYACLQCPYKSTTEYSVKEHVGTHANPNWLKWYKCE